MNSLTLIFAAACLFAIAYRFYGLFLAKRVMREGCAGCCLRGLLWNLNGLHRY